MKVDWIREFWVFTWLESFRNLAEKLVVQCKCHAPRSGWGMKAGYIPRNTMEETGRALIKTAPVEANVIVANSWAEMYPRAFIP